MSDSLSLRETGERGGQKIFVLPFDLPKVIYYPVSGGGTLLCRKPFSNSTVEYEFSHVGQSLHHVGTAYDFVLVYHFKLTLEPSGIVIDNTFAFRVGERITAQLAKNHAEITYQQYLTATKTVLLTGTDAVVYDVVNDEDESGWSD